jgi:hypothetical protein
MLGVQVQGDGWQGVLVLRSSASLRSSMACSLPLFLSLSNRNRKLF